jgi:hypothetical protein
MMAMKIALIALLLVCVVLFALGAVTLVNDIAPGGRKFDPVHVLVGVVLMLAAFFLPHLLLG